MKRQAHRILVGGLAIWLAITNTALLVGRRHSQPVALCRRQTADGYSGLDAITLSPWSRETQINQLADREEHPVELDDGEKTAIGALGGLALALLVFAVIFMVLNDVPPFIITCATGTQAAQMAVLIWVVWSASCEHTGALWAMVASLFAMVVTLVTHARVHIETSDAGSNTFILKF